MIVAMEFYVFFFTVAATIFTLLSTKIFYMVYEKFKVQEKKEIASSPPTSSSPSCPPSSSSPPSSLPRNWIHDVFPSFHGTDVRRSFLSHILKEFRSKGINPFVDNEIERGEFIGHELKTAIQGSKIAIFLLSKNYASSSWCLDELVEIMKCKKDLGQTVIAIFYEVDPSDIKKQAGEFGKVFRKTCKGKTSEVIGKWRQALAQVATVAGYHSTNWGNEAKMIEDIATDVSNKLFNSTSSRDFDHLIGMGAHMERMDLLLRPDLGEVRMIGIWGPPGIGKTTIARVIFNQHSHNFQMSVFVENIKAMSSTAICSSNYSLKLDLQQKFISQILNQKDVKITHLGVAQERLSDKKALVVLDDVVHAVQLEAMAKETGWFGHGSRIIITTQDRKLLRTHRINHIYEVPFPSNDEALQIFCTYAFGQKYPKDGFEELVWEVATLVGQLPLGLEVMGSYLRGMSKEEWSMELPRLRTSLNRDIENVLKYSYDALDKEDQFLFLHIACLFNYEDIEKVVEFLANSFHYDVRQGLNILAERSLIHIRLPVSSSIEMHSLLVKLGKKIVREQSLPEPGQRQFLVDRGEISEILSVNGAGSGKAIGIKFVSNGNDLNISERAFERMSNLQYLKIGEKKKFQKKKIKENTLDLPYGLSYLPPKLRLLDWSYFPRTCLPSNINMKFLLELNMRDSKLEKLWEKNQHLPNLKWMDLSCSENLKELPDISTATKLKKLNLEQCSSLAELPSSIGNATNLENLNLSHCSSLVELPSSIRNATNLKKLNLSHCSSLVELLSSFGNATNLEYLNLKGCSSLVELPSSIGNAINLNYLNLGHCSSLVELPSSIGNATNLKHLNLSHCSSLVELPSSIGNATNLEDLNLSHCSSLAELPSFIWNATNLEKLNLSHCLCVVELPSSIGNATNLKDLYLEGCSKLEVLPVHVNLKSLDHLDLSGCSSLKKFPEISTNIKILDLSGTAIKEVPPSVKTWPHLYELWMSYSENLKEFPDALDTITRLYLTDTKIEEFSPWVKGISRLRQLRLNGCKKLKSLPQLPDSLEFLAAENCESLERLDCSFPDFRINNFINCFKLNQEARDLIIQTSTSCLTVLPGKEIPSYFTYRANGGSLIVKLKKGTFPSSLKFKACILLIKKNDVEARDAETGTFGLWIRVEQNSITCSQGPRYLPPPLTEHLYIFKYEADVTSNELSFEFLIGNLDINSEEWVITECGCIPEKEFKEE